MRLLLDSHTLIWALHAPEKLTPTARREIERAENAVFFSSASIWEIAIKCGKGLLQVSDSLVEEAESTGFVELPIRASHGWAIRSLAAVHKDPFDRLLVAQASLEQLIVVTRDRFLEHYGISILEA